MQNNSWGKRTYVSAMAKDHDPDPGGGEIVDEEMDIQGGSRSDLASQAKKQGSELQKEAARKKFFFQQKMSLEGKRKVLGTGNIVTFLLNDARQGIDMNEMNKVLRVGGFTPEQVVTIKRNDFRLNQVEVLFKKEVEIDTFKVEEKLRKGSMDVIVSMFDHMEEFLVIYGLPPTENMEMLKEKIYESVSPFVKKVLEVKPCLHRGVVGDDFFAGKFDGNWRLKVIPRNKCYIPNFIVVGEDVMAKAVYTKRLGDKEDMCTECYRTGHYRKDCKGSRNWSEYCAEFKDMWDTLMSQVYDNEESEGVVNEEDSRLLSKLTISERERRKVVIQSEKEKTELTSKLQKQAESMEEIKRQKEYADREIEVLTKNLMEAEKKAEIAVTEIQKYQYMQCDDEIREEVFRKDSMIQELETEKQERLVEIEGLKKLSNDVEKILQEENSVLKDQLKSLEAQNLEVMEKMRKFEDNMKVTSRRLSKSHEEVIDLNDTVGTDMFKENSSESPPFHGFSSLNEGSKEIEFQNTNVKVQKSILKRAHSNPSTVVDVSKRKNRHPPIGSKILVDTANESGVFQVVSKRHSSESEYTYSLSKDGKMVTLNLKRVTWEFFDGGEKVVLKGTV